jgi:hypothetical protein
MKKTLFAGFVGLMAIAGVVSCNTDNNNTTIPAAAFGLVNVSPDAGSLDVYLNSTPVVYSLAYGADTGYYNVQAGTYTLNIDSAGSTTQRVSSTITFAPATTYSVFIINSGTELQTAVVTDSVTAPSADSVAIRFLNFSPNATAVDLAVNGTVIASNRSYNDISSNASLAQFGYLAPGTYTAEVRTAGTSTVLYTTSVTLTGGKIYTLYTKGFVGGTESGALSLGTLVHNE